MHEAGIVTTAPEGCHLAGRCNYSSWLRPMCAANRLRVRHHNRAERMHGRCSLLGLSSAHWLTAAQTRTRAQPACFAFSQAGQRKCSGA